VFVIFIIPFRIKNTPLVFVILETKIVLWT
jgi:hypothetical protein